MKPEPIKLDIPKPISPGRPASITLDIPQPLASIVNEFWGQYGGPNSAMFAEPVCDNDWRLRLAMFNEGEAQQIQELLVKISKERGDK